jgi:hypothetical protein
MTPQERRGKRLFLVLAAVIVLDEVAGAGLTVSGGVAELNWFRSVAQPLGFAIAVACLWYGDNWLRWLVGAACVLSGASLIFLCTWMLIQFAGVTPPKATGLLMQLAGYPPAIVGLIGLFYLAAGLLFLFSPAMRAFFRYQREGGRESGFELLDALNAEAGGGAPIMTERFLGNLKLRSGTLVLGDPQYLPGLEIPNVAVPEVAIAARLWRYPSGAETVTALTLRLGDGGDVGTLRKIGEVGIDSGKLVVADKADIEEHWTETGEDRIGVISTARSDAVLHMLTERFNIKTVQVNPVRAEVVGPISEQLAKEIESYLKSDPGTRTFPSCTFMCKRTIALTV